MAIAFASSVYARRPLKEKKSKQRLLKEKVDRAKGLIWKQSFKVQEPLSLSVVPLISSLQCSSAGDFLVTHALAAHDRRSTADLADSSCAHLALLQRTAENYYSFNKNTQTHRADGKGHPC